MKRPANLGQRECIGRRPIKNEINIAIDFEDFTDLFANSKRPSIVSVSGGRACVRSFQFRPRLRTNASGVITGKIFPAKLAHADVLIDFGLASNREQHARKRLPGGLKPGAVPARHHLYLLPKLCAASQQKNEEQNRNWNTEKPEQDVLVALVSLLMNFISISVNTYSSERE